MYDDRDRGTFSAGESATVTFCASGGSFRPFRGAASGACAVSFSWQNGNEVGMGGLFIMVA